VALPGTNGFIGEFLILVGAFKGEFSAANAQYYTAVAATGVILSAVYMLWMFQRVNYGPMTNAKNRGLRDLSPREWVVIAPICAMAVVMGVVPGVFLRPMEPAVRKAVQMVVPSRATANTDAAVTPPPDRTASNAVQTAGRAR
jgi:NADH-quinone oxidoreductase subunit M